MKKAIEILRNNGVEVSNEGVILSELPYDMAGIELVDKIENETMADDQAALDIINLWMECEGYEQFDIESIKSKTEANLY